MSYLPKLARDRRSGDGRRRRRRPRRGVATPSPALDRLEVRRLLAGGVVGLSSLALAGVAAPLTIGGSSVGTVDSRGAVYYEITAPEDGRLTIRIDMADFPARLALLDSGGGTLVQSDGATSGGQGALIDEHISANTTYYVQIKSGGGGGSYRIQADLTDSGPPFQPISANLLGGGSSLVIGDFDGDGHQIPDLVTPDGVRRGLGDGTFSSEFVGGPLADDGFDVRSIVSADFNGDHRPDLAVLENAEDYSTSRVRILLNDGGGHFSENASFELSPDAGSIQVVDFGDGIVDLAVADPYAGQISILVGDGAGGFTTGPVFDGGFTPVGMVAGRFGDGFVDLVVANLGDFDTGDGQGLTVFRAEAPDRFVFKDNLVVGSMPVAVTAADLDGDGMLDLAVADSESNDVAVLLNEGDGTFSPPAYYAVGGLPQSIVALSTRGDGRLDLTVANSNSADVSILLNNGDGTFQPQARYGAGTNPLALVPADLNGDGVVDLAATDTGAGDGSVVILLGRGDGTFQDSLTNPVGITPSQGATVDLNHDGYTDILTVNYYSNSVSVLLGRGDGYFSAATDYPVGDGPTAIAVGDFNGDGRLDLAITLSPNLYGAPKGVAILLGNGDGTFQKASFVDTSVGEPPEISPSLIVACDFTGDGILDLAVANNGSNDVSILKGNGRGGFDLLAPINLGDAGSDPVSLVACDFTGDGILDLAVVSRGDGSFSILAGQGDGNFTQLPAVPVPIGPFGRLSDAAVGDFTGDGVADLAIVTMNSPDDDGVEIFPGMGAGIFGSPIAINLGRSLEPRSIVAAQLFAGGPTDLAVADANAQAVSLIESLGGGNFLLHPAIPLSSQGLPSLVLAQDFNNDGVIDLAVVRQSPNSVAIELNQGNGNFLDPGSIGLSPHNTPLLADLDGDGVPDLTVVDAAGDILFRRGQSGRPGSYDPPIAINAAPSGSVTDRINPYASRDLAAVATDQGTVLASVNATNSMISLFAYRGGQFRLIRSLATGQGSAQLVAADLLGDGSPTGLVVRNAGAGTLTIYTQGLLDLSSSRSEIAVGLGVSDVSTADLDGDGLPDILITNQATGQVEVIRNEGRGRFADPVPYRSGIGLSAAIASADGGPPSVVSRERTAGAVPFSATLGGPIGLVTLNPGAADLGVLAGLGDDRFANPIATPMARQGAVLRAGDFNGDGASDLAILTADGIEIRMGTGQGTFLAATLHDAGMNPTGLALGDINHDGHQDLIVGDAAGDVLFLLGDGHGAFRPPTQVDRSVSLAVGDVERMGVPTFVIANQSSDRVVIRRGDPSASGAVIGDRTTGLDLPGAPVLADLNGDGILDLIVANTGGNNVLVYLGQPDGTFGQEVNAGKGFFTGTNPVAIVVADVNGDRLPDLMVADKGSNDVAVLINQTEGSKFSLTSGPRLSVGYGPTALALKDVNGDGRLDLLVSDGTSKDVRILPGVGGGFFNDVSPKVIPLPTDPGEIFVGNFGGNSDGVSLVILNPGTSTVTWIPNPLGDQPVLKLIPSGGLNPISAASFGGSDGFDGLVVANHDDGHLALLVGGESGLTLDSVAAPPGIPSPTAVDYAQVQGNHLNVYATNEAAEFASLVVLTLGGSIGPNPTTPGPILTLLSSQNSSIPLIATLLTTFLSFESEEGGDGESSADVASNDSEGASAGQGLAAVAVDNEQGDDEDVAEDESPPAEEDPILDWFLNVLGLDEAFEEFRIEFQPSAPGRETRANGPTSSLAPGVTLDSPAGQSSKPAPSKDAMNRPEFIDEALDALSEETPVRASSAEPFGFDRPDGDIVATGIRSESDTIAPVANVLMIGGMLLAVWRPVRPRLALRATPRRFTWWRRTSNPRPTR